MFGQIPISIKAFKLYLDGLLEVGTVDVELPNLQFMTDTLSGSGIAGEVEMPLPLIQSMSMKIKKRAVNKQFTTLLSPMVHILTLRGTLALADPGQVAGMLKERKIRIVANVMPKGKNLGKFERAKAMDTESEFSVMSIRIFVDEVPSLHIDPFNEMLVIDGINYLDNDGFL